MRLIYQSEAYGQPHELQKDTGYSCNSNQLAKGTRHK